MINQFKQWKTFSHYYCLFLDFIYKVTWKFPHLEIQCNSIAPQWISVVYWVIMMETIASWRDRPELARSLHQSRCSMMKTASDYQHSTFREMFSSPVSSAVKQIFESGNSWKAQNFVSGYWPDWKQLRGKGTLRGCLVKWEIINLGNYRDANFRIWNTLCKYFCKYMFIETKQSMSFKDLLFKDTEFSIVGSFRNK